MSLVKLYYPELLIRYEDIQMMVLGELKNFERTENDGDLGDYILPIFLSKEECEKFYPDCKISCIMFGIYEN
jgi:hypothetical protein